MQSITFAPLEAPAAGPDASGPMPPFAEAAHRVYREHVSGPAASHFRVGGCGRKGEEREQLWALQPQTSATACYPCLSTPRPRVTPRPLQTNCSLTSCAAPHLAYFLLPGRCMDTLKWRHLACLQAQGPSLLRWKFNITEHPPFLEFGCIPASLRVGAGQ
jgi:hypothetical protein